MAPDSPGIVFVLIGVVFSLDLSRSKCLLIMFASFGSWLEKYDSWPKASDAFLYGSSDSMFLIWFVLLGGVLARLCQVAEADFPL